MDQILITRDAYRKAFIKAMEAEMNDLRERGMDALMSLLVASAATGVSRRIEETLFGEQEADELI